MFSQLFCLLGFLILSNGQLTWNELTVSSNNTDTPSPRVRPAIAYDNINDILIIFGGKIGDDTVFDDTWIFNLQTREWKELTTTNNPQARFDALAGYDSNTKQFIISTGDNADEKWFNDIWALKIPDYDQTSYSWERLDKNSKNKPETRYGIGGGLDTLDSSTFYISHGFSTTRWLDSYKFDIRSNTSKWKKIWKGGSSYSVGYPHGRCLVATNPIKDGFAMFGGCLTAGGAGGPCPGLDSWIYTQLYGWKQLNNLPVPSINSDSCNYWNDDKFILIYGGQQDILPLQKIGGRDINGKDVHIANIKSGKIRTFKSFNAPKNSIASHRMIRTNNSCLLFGGVDGKTEKELNIVYELTGTINSKDKISDIKPYFSMLYLHGIFMYLSWGIMLQLGGFIARYFRHLDPWWFRPMHLYCQRVGFTISLIGVIFGFIGGGPPVVTHAIIGMLIILISFGQVIYGECRPSHDHKRRWLFERLHKNSGRLLLLLGLINITLGVFLIVAPKGVYVTWLLQLAIIVTFYIVFELNKRGYIDIKYLRHEKKDETSTAVEITKS